jgi:hypothetical protein
VTKGDVIGRIGAGPADPHLHFELRIVVDPSDRRFWSDRNSVAVNPTRLLYRADTADAPAPYSVPMYEPSTEHERGLASVFTKALQLGRAVEVEYRDSVFFGPHRVPVSVRPRLTLDQGGAGFSGRRRASGAGRTLGSSGTAELGRRRWRDGGLPSAGC